MINYNLENIITFDENRIRDICDGDVEFSIEFIESAISSFKEEKEIIESLSDLSNLEALSFIIHKIKSTSSAIGGLKVNRIAVLIYRAINDDNSIDTDDLNYLIEEIDILIKKMVNFTL